MAIQKLKLEQEQELQTPFASINEEIDLLARSQHQLANFIQDDIIENISRAEAKADSCREKRKVVAAVVEADSRIRDFSSRLLKLQLPAAKLQHKAKSAARKEWTRFQTLYEQLGTIGQLTERGHALVVQAQDRAIAAKEINEVMDYTYRFIFIVNRRVKALHLRWKKLAEEGQYVRSQQLLETKPCARSSRVDKLLNDARQLSLESLDENTLFRM